MDYLLWLQSIRNDTLNIILMAVTDFITSPVVYVGIALLYWCFNKRAGIFIAMNISGGSLVNQALKNTFCVLRPWILNPKITPVPEAMETATGYSFPSGHTQIASGEFISVAYWQKHRRWLVAVCIAITLMVMFTRNYLGVHTPQDVLVSLAVSVIVIFINDKMLNWADGKKSRDLIILGIGLVLTAVFLVYTTLKTYPVNPLCPPEEMIVDCYSAGGCVAGFLIGWVCERHFLNFKTDISKKAKAIRGVIGTIMLLLLVVLLMKPITSLHPYWGEFGFFAFAFVFILFIYPLLFKLWETKAEQFR